MSGKYAEYEYEPPKRSPEEQKRWDDLFEKWERDRREEFERHCAQLGIDTSELEPGKTYRFPLFKKKEAGADGG